MEESSDINLNLPSDEELERAHELVKPKNSVGKIEISKKELLYREKKTENILETEKLSCTSCGKDLKAYLRNSSNIFSHPFLDVLLCKSCAEFYSGGEFSVDEDGTDKYCRWCGQGGTLYLCSECNFGFCKACIKRNLHRSVLSEVLQDDWKCFSCNSRPLWDLRALCAGTLKYVKELKKSKSTSESKSYIRKPSHKVATISSSEEEQVVKKKGSSEKKADGETSRRSEKRKRKRKGSSSTGEEAQNRKKKTKRSSSDTTEAKQETKKSSYDKKMDRKVTLDTQDAEELIYKFKEQVKSIFEVVKAITYEVKKLVKEELIVENMLEYQKRKEVLKKVVSVDDMSCNTLSQAFDNILMTYQSEIVNIMHKTDEKKRLSVSKNSTTSEMKNSCKSEEREEKSKMENPDDHFENKECKHNKIENTITDTDMGEEVLSNDTDKTQVNCELEKQTKELKKKIESKCNKTKSTFSDTDKSDEEFLSNKTDKNTTKESKTDIEKKLSKTTNICSDTDKSEEELLSDEINKKQVDSEPEKLPIESKANVEKKHKEIRTNFSDTDKSEEELLSDGTDKKSTKESKTNKKKLNKTKNILSDKDMSDNEILSDGSSEKQRNYESGNSTKETETNCVIESENNETKRNESSADSAGEDHTTVTDETAFDDTSEDKKSKDDMKCNNEMDDDEHCENDSNKNNEENGEGEKTHEMKQNSSNISMDHDGDLTDSDNLQKTEQLDQNKSLHASNGTAPNKEQEREDLSTISEILDKHDLSNSEPSSSEVSGNDVNKICDIDIACDKLLLQDCDLKQQSERSVKPVETSKLTTKIGSVRENENKLDEIHFDVEKQEENELNQGKGQQKEEAVVLSGEDVISDSESEKLCMKKNRVSSEDMKRGSMESGIDSRQNNSNGNNFADARGATKRDNRTLHSKDTLSDNDNSFCFVRSNTVSDESDGGSGKLSYSLLSSGKTTSNKTEDIKKESISSASCEENGGSQVRSEDENRKALMCLLSRSSSDDDSSVTRKRNRIDINERTEKCGPLCSKSVAYQNAFKMSNDKSGVFSNASEDTDSASVGKLFVKSDDTTVDDVNVKKCHVHLNRLPDDVYKKYYVCLEGTSKGNLSESEEIEKLINLKSLEVVKKKFPSVDSDTDSDGIENVNKKKVYRKHIKKKEETKETLKDFHNNGISSSSNHSDSSDQEHKEERRLKNIFDKIHNAGNKIAVKLLLKSSSSDSDDISPKEEDEKKNKEKDSGGKGKEKNKKGKKEENEGEKEEEKDEDEKKKEMEVDEKKKEVKDEDKKKKEVEDEDEKKKEVEDEDRKKKEAEDEEEEEVSDENVERRKVKSWRKNKILCMRLSETDTSDEERRWKAKKEREAKQEDKGSESDGFHTKKKNRKNIGNRRLINSDSDEIIISSESSESDSDDFKPINKRKRTENSDSNKSDKKSSGSESEKSVPKKKPKRRRIQNTLTDSSDDGDGLNNSQKSETTPSKGRKNIRRVLKDDDVAEATRRAAKEEEERRKRIAEKQKLYNSLFDQVRAQVETIDKLVLDFDSETKKELVQVDPNLVKKLKPHQVKGVKFMWDACFESLEHIKKSEGSGCILAHCMGLGKTLQVIALVHTVLNNPKTKVKTVLVVCPLSTVLNWVNEFSKWLDQTEDNDIEVLELTKYKQVYERVGVLKHWRESGGVMILAYNLYRILANPTGKKQRKKNVEILQNALVDPGPDLVICDEGHLLKNEGSALSKTMNRIRTKRRIVLTGTPLQNNLLEYHCMVQFVKPNLLGTKKEFTNRFVNPINNGQYDNSTAHDVKVMKRRAHVLHKMLDSSVQRYDYSVLTPFLPPKFEYVLLIRLSELQIKLYKYYLQNFASIGDEGTKTKTAQLFRDFHALQRIWTHPRVLLLNSEKVEKKRLLEESDSEGSLRDFIASSSEDSTTSTDSDIEEIDSKSKMKRKPITRSNKNNDDDDNDDGESVKSTASKDEQGENGNNSGDWWRQFITDESVLEDIKESGKIALLFTILEECEKIGDKILIFSQSLLSLDLIEYFLRKVDEASDDEDNSKTTGNKASWVLGLDYFRLDGSSNPENRAAWCKTFNKEDNYRARLFLISTRAGGLGINLVAANRVILFDASWNPSYDLQSIFRIYRFGQNKPCYVYRFLAQHTMEEKVYNRQVTKLSLACRVVDEQQIERHYSMDDLRELYNFNPEEKKSKETPLVPKDVLLAELVKGEDSWINSYHEHDTLLENKEEEELNEEERKAAWEDYEKEKQGIRNNVTSFDNSAILNYLNQFGYTELQIRDSIIRENPGWSELQIQYQVSRVLRQIFDYVSAEEYRKQIQMHYGKGHIQQPLFHQAPQTHGVMQQHQMLPHTGQQYLQTTSQNSVLQQQGSSQQHLQVVPSTSQHNTTPHNTVQQHLSDSQQRIKVKSFGHMMNSNFGNTPRIVPNPFGAHATKTNPGSSNNQLTAKKSTISKTVTEVLEID